MSTPSVTIPPVVSRATFYPPIANGQIEPASTHASLPSASERQKRSEPGDEQPSSPAPRWRLPAALEPNPDRASADTALGKGLLTSIQGGYSIVQVPAGTSMASALDVYRAVLAEPQLQAWFTSKGLETDTLTLHKDSVSGYVNRDGVRTAVTFSTSDSSGWWQVSAKLRAIREVLDPADKGMNYLTESAGWLSHSLVLQAFGLKLPSSIEEKAQLTTQLSTADMAMSAELYERFNSRLQHARQTIAELGERAELADKLEGDIAGLADDLPYDGSQLSVQPSSGSVLAASDQTARERLQRFIQSDAVKTKLIGLELFWPGQPFRVSEGKFEHLTPQGAWVDLTSYIAEVATLSSELNALVRLSEGSGNAVYSVPQYDMRQVLDHKGLGSPRTVGEVRNAVKWLRSGLPPAPPLENYAGLMAPEWSPGLLTESDKTTLKRLASERWGGENPTRFTYLSELTVQALQENPGEHLEKMLNSADALAFGEQLARILKWHESPLSKASRQQLVIAALTLHVDPHAPAKPGFIAGYALYQPANMGRTFCAIRRDVERHLQVERGLDPKLAVLMAHIGLAQAAPEFLLKDVPTSVHVGTPAWMELRLGAAMADQIAPGTSRAMNEEQVAELTTLAPTSKGQEALMQLHALKILLDWAVLNGVIPAAVDGQHPLSAIKTACEAFFKQRGEVNTAMNAVAEMPTRRSLAIQALRKVFPDVSVAQLEGMKVLIADANVRRNMSISEPRTRSLIETYMTGDLIPDKWILASDMPPTLVRTGTTPFQLKREIEAPAEKRAALDALIRRLPALDRVLEPAVNAHRQTLQAAYATQLKLMFCELPLADRQLLENGSVKLYTIRGETGLAPAEETDAHRSALQGRQGTLIRAQQGDTVVYYEVFAHGKIVKRTDLPKTLKLGNVLGDKPNPLGLMGIYVTAFTGGFSLGVDYDAYANGTEPRSNVTSNVIVKQLGEPVAATAPAPDGAGSAAVPDTYASAKTHSIATRIAEDNFYEAADVMLQRAKGTLPLEQLREALGREKAILKGLVPFVGAYQEFASGNIGGGFYNLTLDLGGLALGAGGRVRSLIRAGKALSPNPVVGVVRRLGSAVRPLTPRLAWTKPVASFGDRAFNFLKESALFASAAMNPADGYGQLVSAGVKGLLKLPVIASGVSKLGKAAPHLITVEEKLRSFWLAGAWDPVTSSQDGAMPGTAQGHATHATKMGRYWYAINPKTGQASGTPLLDFKPTNTPVA